MYAWLGAWGEDVPEAAADDGMTGMPDAYSADDQSGAMSDLSGISGDAFDRAFLTEMIAHHEGAIEMSRQHLRAGSAPATLSLASAIIDAQELEITEIEAMLGR